MLNKHIKRTALALSLALTLSITPNANAKSKAETVKNIQDVVESYFKGTSTGNQELLSNAFHEQLDLIYVRDGKIKYWPGEGYIKSVPEGVSNKRKGKIISIDISNDIAMVKAEINSPSQNFVDYLILLNDGEKWKIVSKGFTSYQCCLESHNVKFKYEK